VAFLCTRVKVFALDARDRAHLNRVTGLI